MNDRHAVFGRVIEGEDVVRKIGDAPRDRSDRPLTPVKMTTVRVVPAAVKKS